ncbi:hypothetical protein CK203_087472 [Vitis vinifera]|uniref:Uncharacterized protein n=1 Tax=Vitis vinifera TaxID=29760 RepID=A0A438EN38_VITVI|nr:hypothetical protein CK203_087472 [Vitis vinifera]
MSSLRLSSPQTWTNASLHPEMEMVLCLTLIIGRSNFGLRPTKNWNPLSLSIISLNFFVLGPLLGVDNLPFQLKYLRRNTYLGYEIELTRPFTNNAKSDGDEGHCRVMAMKLGFTLQLGTIAGVGLAIPNARHAEEVRHRLRKDYGIEGGIPVVFSLEKPKVKLLPFKGSNEKRESFRLPVRMIACYFEVHTEPVVNLDTDHYHILHQRLIEHEELLYGTAMQVQGNLMIP